MPLLIAIALFFVVAYVALSRSRQLFRISIRKGKPLVTHGYVPPGLLADFAEAVRSVQRGEIAAHKAEGGARLSFSGDIDGGVAQRLRNIFGLYPVARLRAPHLDKRQAVSDAFTLAWFVSIVRNWFR